MSPPTKTIHQLADAKIIELHSKALNSPNSYPFFINIQSKLSVSRFSTEKNTFQGMIPTYFFE